MAIEQGRIYEESHWAVRRWDRFHNGGRPVVPNGERFVKPKSFCQFWRTVLLWATLQQIPFAGGMFVPPGARPKKPPKPIEVTAHDDEWDPFKSKYLRNAGHVAWGVLLPVRLLVMGIVKGFQSAAAYVDDRPRLKGALENLLVGVMFLGLAVFVAMGVFLGGRWFITEAWPWLLSLDMNIWWTVIGCVVAFPFACALLYLVVLTAIKGLAATGKVILDAGGMVWDALVTGKKAICPPMEIERTASYPMYREG